jgi:hypothetical protein
MPVYQQGHVYRSSSHVPRSRSLRRLDDVSKSPPLQCPNLTLRVTLLFLGALKRDSETFLVLARLLALSGII